MSGHFKVGLVLFILGLIAMIGYKFGMPYYEAIKQRDTSDASGTKATIVVGMDNWIGYYPLCSAELRKRMRHEGYLLQCEDDQANYPQRMQQLKRGKLQFAVATVDAYLLNGQAVNFPGAIIAVIDESKGGDGIVAWEDRLANLESFKQQNSSIAFTPNSPSEFFLKSLAVHFDLPLKKSDKIKQVHTDGSKAALKKLLDKEVDAAVLWEPDLSKALSTKSVKKLLGTEQTEKLIVDVLLVNREFADANPEVIQILLKQYFEVLTQLQSDRNAFTKGAAEAADVPARQADAMLNGVRWASLNANAYEWFGIRDPLLRSEEGLVDVLESNAAVLLDANQTSSSPIPGRDPYRLINSRYVQHIMQQSNVQNLANAGGSDDSLTRSFAALGEREWALLREVGTLRVRPILFQSGRDELTLDGKTQLDEIIAHLKHYPQFRILIRGHTSARGDASANKALSQDRAEAVKRYFNVTFGIHEQRMLAQGLGGERPLPRVAGEAERDYQYKLSRVEVVLVADKL